MIDRLDLIDMFDKHNIVLDKRLFKKRKEIDFIDRLVLLLNGVLIYGSRNIVVSKDVFLSSLGKNYYRSFLFGMDLEKNDEFFNDAKVNKFLSKESEILRFLFHRIDTGYKFSNGDFKIAGYKINNEIFKLYESNKSKLSNKKVLKSIIDVNESLDLMDDISNVSKKNIVKSVDMTFDKSELSTYFLENVKKYNYKHLRKKYPYRTLNSIHDEIQSFIKSYLYFNDYLTSRNKYLVTEYTQATTQRYFTFLGMLDKRVRKHFLKEYLEFDLDAAAPNMLYQYYLGLKHKKLSLVNEVITNKKAIRSYIGEVIFMSSDIPKKEKIKYSKKFLTSLFFGSTPNHKGKNATNDILLEVSEITGIKYKKLKDNFYDNQIIKDLIKEVKYLMNKLDDYLTSTIQKTNNKNIDVLNIHGKKIEVHYKSGKKRKNTRIAYFYQSWESLFLDEEVKVLNKKFKIKKNYLMNHDAIYIYKEELHKKNITELDIRNEFKKIRVTDIDIEPLI